MRFLPVLLGVLLLCHQSFTQRTAYQQKFPLIDAYIDSMMTEWNIPGLALGIVYKDQLIHAKGFGYRDVEKKLPVQITTLFPIASNTKLFTATLLCMLEIENKLDLDKPVTTYLPHLNFNNEELTAKITVRDMLSHRTGLPRYDGIWVASPAKRKELVAKVAFMKPQLLFRDGYIYNNMMYALAGVVLEEVTANNWEAVTRSALFEPLDMKASCFTAEEAVKYGNYAVSYLEDSTGHLVKRTFLATSEALGPAGTIKSNVEDMSHWIIAQINGGRYKGKQVIPEAAIKETQIPQTISDKSGRWPELSHPLYGLGRNILTYKSRQITTHTGAIDGFFSNLTLLPFDSLGIFIIYNSETAGSIRSVIALPILDRLLGFSYTPWSERYRKDYLQSKVRQKQVRDSLLAGKVKNTTPSHPLNSYTGLYQHPVYGDVQITLRQDQLQLLFRKQQSTLHHFHYDQFVTKESNDIPVLRLHFFTNSKGDIDRFSMQPYGDPVVEFVKKI